MNNRVKGAIFGLFLSFIIITIVQHMPPLAIIYLGTILGFIIGKDDFL